MQQNVSLFRRRFLGTALLAVWLTGVVPVLAQEVPVPKAGEQETAAPALSAGRSGRGGKNKLEGAGVDAAGR